MWILPNDAWLTLRETTFVANIPKVFEKYVEIMDKATTPGDFYRRMENDGVTMRLDDTIWPTRNKCATVSLPEIEELKKVKNIIRQGRIAKIEEGLLVFENESTVVTHSSWLHVDCSAKRS